MDKVKISNKGHIDDLCYIAPDGILWYAVGDVVSLHSDVGQHIFPDLNFPCDVMENLGWIRVNSVVGPKVRIKIPPTQSQINAMYDLDILNNLHIVSECGRFWHEYDLNK